MDFTELKKTRLFYGLSQKEMARVLQMTKGHYANLESGKRNITEELAKRVVDIRDVMFPKTHKDNLVGSIDWIRIRFKTLNFGAIIKKLLKLKVEEMSLEEKAFYSYEKMLTYGNIRCLTSVRKEENGTLIEMTGVGCRQYEDLMLSMGIEHPWEYLIKSAFEFAEENRGRMKTKDYLAFTRLDIALDELYDKENGNLDLYDIYHDVVNRKLMFRKMKKFNVVDGYEEFDGELVKNGLTLNFGSRQSPINFRFYQKDYEQASMHDFSVETVHEIEGYKNRYEIELHADKGYEVLQYWLNNEKNITEIAVEIMNSYFLYFDEEDGLNRDWYELFGLNKAFKFQIKPVQFSVEKTRNWLLTSVANSYKMTLISDMYHNRSRLLEETADVELSERAKKMLREDGLTEEEIRKCEEKVQEYLLEKT